MARIWLSEILQDIRGSVGEHVYSVWKAGVHYLRSKAAVILNPRSSDQQNMRTRLGFIAGYWGDSLTEAQRNAWNEYAENMTPIPLDGGGTKELIPHHGGVMSGFNAFVLNNALNYSAGNVPIGTALANPPNGVTPPAGPTDLECLYCKANGNSVIRLTWTDPVTPAEGFRIRVWIVSNDSGVHKQLVASVANGIQTYDIDLVNVALGIATHIDTLPGSYHIQIDAVDDYGQQSVPSNICQEEVTTDEPAACV